MILNAAVATYCEGLLLSSNFVTHVGVGIDITSFWAGRLIRFWAGLALILIACSVSVEGKSRLLKSCTTRQKNLP